MRRKLIYCVAAACTAMLLCGCAKMENGRGKNGHIRINVKSDNATKADAVTTSSLEAAGKFVVDVFATDKWTKVDDYGNPVGDKHEAGSYITSGGAANVLYSSASQIYTPGSEVRPGDDATEGWYIYDSKGFEAYNWINGIKLRFWARYPQDSEINVNGASLSVSSSLTHTSTTETFTYSLPTAAAGSDATNQKDILFAYTERTKQKQDANDDIDITFHHALSEVRFCVSPDDGTFDVSLKIKSIEITDVPSSGTCTFKPSGTIADQNMFIWGSYGALESYSQDYNASFDVAPTGWDGSEYDTTNHKHIYTCQNAFMLIPHTTSASTKLMITFYDTIEGTDVPSREVNIKDTVLKPGHYYTYKICAIKVGRSISSYVVLTDWSDHDSKINIPC